MAGKKRIARCPPMQDAKRLATHIIGEVSTGLTYEEDPEFWERIRDDISTVRISLLKATQCRGPPGARSNTRLREALRLVKQTENRVTAAVSGDDSDEEDEDYEAPDSEGYGIVIDTDDIESTMRFVQRTSGPTPPD